MSGPDGQPALVAPLPEPQGVSAHSCDGQAQGVSSADLANRKFRGPVRFYDGRGGWARQDFESIENPRFGYAWQRESRKDKGRTWFMVDGAEVANFDEADRLLATAPSPKSPAEKMRADMDEFHSSPPVGMATRALSEARVNADAGPFAGVRAAMQRVDHGWHVGLNRLNEKRRENGDEFDHSLYNAKTAAHETYRSLFLWGADRLNDTGLKCVLGVKCRACPILAEIEAALIESRDTERFGRPEIEIEDIDFAKTWACIGHILQEKPGAFVDGAFFTTANDRKHPW